MSERVAKIQLQAVYTKNGAVRIFDQDLREFDAVPDTLASARDAEERILVGITLEVPRWPTDQPHAEITFRVPLKVEERLPQWMQDYLAENA